jgi:hypothetical protein
MLCWDQYGFDKKRIRTRYTKLGFLHPVGAAGHKVHSGTSRVRNIDTIFFMLGWDRYGCQKNCAETRYAELVLFASGGIYGSRSAFR